MRVIVLKVIHHWYLQSSFFIACRWNGTQGKKLHENFFEISNPPSVYKDLKVCPTTTYNVKLSRLSNDCVNPEGIENSKMVFRVTKRCSSMI